jgi:cytoskeleton protein RodZ
MAGIGASLREARMRQRIDITEAEADTKIRGKYLRALENEEWALLPGPTFVKSFLRTYADYLGLDGRSLVEEFKLKYERPEMQAIAPPRPREQGRRQRSSRGRPPGDSRIWIALALVAVILIGLFALGRGDDNKNSGTSAGTTTKAKTPATTTTASGNGSKPAKKAAVATVKIVPTGQLYVCLRDATGRRLLDGVILQPGAATKTFRSSKFRLSLGNNEVRLLVNGTRRAVPSVKAGVGYAITPTSFTRLSGSERPSCT